MQTENTDLNSKVVDLEKKLCKLQSEHDESKEILTDTKSALRQAELNCNKLYKDISGQNSKHVTKIHDSQLKFEEASLVISR